MPRTASASEPQAIGFLLVPALLDDGLRLGDRAAARRQSARRPDALSLGDRLRDGAAVAASNGMALVADRSIRERTGHAKLVVCAGFEPERFYDAADRRLAAARQPARQRSRRHGHRQLPAGPRRAARRLPRHHPLGEPRQLSRAVPQGRGRIRPVRHRPPSLHLRRRHRGARHDAAPDRAAAWPAAWPPPCRSSSSTPISATRRTASAWSRTYARASPMPASARSSR